MILKRTFACLCLLLAGLAVTAQERPRLVVGVVVDQMRWDYLYRYYDLYGEGGFKRLMNEGFNCENTMINYIPSITAVGHRAGIYRLCAVDTRHRGQPLLCRRQVRILRCRLHSEDRRQQFDCGTDVAA